MNIKPFGPNRPILRGLRSGIGKSAIIYPVSILHSIALGTINLGIVFYLRDKLESSPTEVGIIAALFSIAYFVGCFVFRPFTRVLLPRFSLLLSTTANVFFVGGMLLFENAVAVAICNILFGFGVSLFWPPIMGWLSIGLEGSHLGKALGKFNLSWSAGLIVSPYFAGLLTEIDVTYPIIACMILLSLTSLIVIVGAFAIPSIRNDRHLEPAVQNGTDAADHSSPLRYPAWVGVVGAYLLMGIFGVVFPMHARMNLGLNESTIGGALLLRAVANATTFMIFGRIAAWHHKSVPIVIPQIILIGCCLVLVFFESVGVYLVVLPVIGACMAFAYTESVFHGVSGAVARARRMAIHEALLVSGMVTGSLGGSFVFQISSVRQVFLLATVILIIVVIVQSVLICALGRRGKVV
jgi:MFS family permease